MKKLIIALFFLMLSLELLACSSPSKQHGDESEIKVVCTTFAAYDWTRQIVKGLDNYQVSYLTDSGVDIHSYNPSVSDAANIITADLLIYIGGPSDEWVAELLTNNEYSGRRSISLLDILSDRIVEEEIKEGMYAKEEDEGDEIEYDEHVWLSPNNSIACVEKIKTELIKINPSDTSVLSANADSYIEDLEALATDYKEAVEEGTNHIIVVCDRFPFRYLFDDYDIDYYAAFPGCSAESEAGFDTIVFLSGKIDELNLTSVSILEGTANDISRAVISNCSNEDIYVVTLNSMQSVSLKDVENGADYISISRKNLDAIRRLCR